MKDLAKRHWKALVSVFLFVSVFFTVFDVSADLTLNEKFLDLLLQAGTENPLTIRNSTDVLFIVYRNGSTRAIGDANIDGTLKINSLRMSNGAVNGYVLTSDSSGTGTWQAVSGGGGGPGGGWTNTSGAVVLANANDKVGIGTNSPQHKLSVSGRVNLDGALYTAAALWNTSIVPDTGDVGRYTNTIVDGGRYYISYYDTGSQDLKYANSSDGGTSWTRNTIYSTGSVGAYNSLTRSVSTGNYYISFYDAVNGNLMVAVSTSGGVNYTTSAVEIGNDVGSYSSAFAYYNGAADNVYVVHYDATNYDLRFVKSDDSGSSWSFSGLVDSSGKVGSHASLTGVDQDTIFAAYYDMTNRRLKFANSSTGGSGWTKTVIENASSGGDVGKYTDIFALNKSHIFVSYRDNGNGYLKFAKTVNGGTTWSTAVVDNSGGTGIQTSIYANDSNNIVISYFDAKGNDLRLAQTVDGGASWNTSAIDSVGGAGQYPSIFSTDNSTFFVSYYDGTNGALRFAKTVSGLASSNVGVGVSIPEYPFQVSGTVNIENTVYTSTGDYDAIPINTTSNIGLYPSIDVVGGNIYIASYDATNTRPLLSKSTDGGLTWTSSAIITSGQLAASTAYGQFNTLRAFDENNLFWSSTNGTYVWFANSSDGGATWRLTIAPTSSSGGSDYSSITVPTTSEIYIPYYTGSGFRLSRSTDGGVTWNNTNYNGSFNARYYSADYGDENTVYVSYYDATNARMSLAKSRDKGASFEFARADPRSSSGQYSSMDAIDNKTMFIAHSNGAALLFSKSHDGGYMWTHVMVDSSVSVTQGIWLSAADNSTLYISYYDGSNANLKLAKSLNGGLNWTLSTLEGQGTVGQYATIKAIDSKQAYIAYYEGTNQDLKFLRSPDTKTRYVGIGTTSPSSQLEVHGGLGRGKITLNGTYGACLIMRDIGNGNIYYCKMSSGTWTCDTTFC